jgi:hypothetical protein
MLFLCLRKELSTQVLIEGPKGDYCARKGAKSIAKELIMRPRFGSQAPTNLGTPLIKQFSNGAKSMV